VSYAHQREFALQGGVDVVSATLWPLSVDGLLLLATVGLLNSARGVAAAETRFEGGPNRDRDETKAPRERKSQRTETRQRRIGESRARAAESRLAVVSWRRHTPGHRRVIGLGRLR
jgi:hypothetical protein